MGENSAIEWTDHTFNPWIGCQKVGPGCDHCYAETLSKARLGVAWGPGAERRRTATSTWQQPRRWNRKAAAEGRRYRVFCASLADVFDNAVPAEWRADLFALIHETPHLDWLLVTKRIGNATAMAEAAGGWPENVWLGATVVNQAEADRDAPKLLATKGPRFRFLSMEPLLGPVAFDPCDLASLDWIIVGGESGSGARPMHPDWVRSLRDQCAVAGMPFLFKQWGEWAPQDSRAAARPEDAGRLQSFTIVSSTEPGERGKKVFYAFPEIIHKIGVIDAHRLICVGKKAAGRLLDGVQHDGLPA